MIFLLKNSTHKLYTFQSQIGQIIALFDFFEVFFTNNQMKTKRMFYRF